MSTNTSLTISLPVFRFFQLLIPSTLVLTFKSYIIVRSFLALLFSFFSRNFCFGHWTGKNSYPPLSSSESSIAQLTEEYFFSKDRFQVFDVQSDSAVLDTGEHLVGMKLELLSASTPELNLAQSPIVRSFSDSLGPPFREERSSPIDYGDSSLSLPSNFGDTNNDPSSSNFMSLSSLASLCNDIRVNNDAEIQRLSLCNAQVQEMQASIQFSVFVFSQIFIFFLYRNILFVEKSSLTRGRVILFFFLFFFPRMFRWFADHVSEMIINSIGVKWENF